MVLAFLFGYSFTMAPLLRTGMALGALIKVALAADTVSIAIMEVVDNAIMLVIPGAVDAGLNSLLDDDRPWRSRLLGCCSSQPPRMVGSSSRRASRSSGS